MVEKLGFKALTFFLYEHNNCDIIISVPKADINISTSLGSKLHTIPSKLGAKIGCKYPDWVQLHIVIGCNCIKMGKWRQFDKNVVEQSITFFFL